MFTSLKRAFLATTFVGLSLAFAVPAVASTASYNWSDITGQLTTTANRPVWASAYAGGNWFYTDGQDLWNGGQAYRYDGATQVNITTEIRNAGLNRVDDIVSDGQSTLFLQNMTARNNQFTAVEYLNGSYVNVSNALRNAFNSDEGIGNIAGRNGDWYITTSKGRVLHWFGNTSTPTQVTLPSNLQLNVSNAYQNFQSNYIYGGFSYKNTLFTIVPASGNQWLFVYGASFYSYATPYVITDQLFRYDGSSFTDLSANLTHGSNGSINNPDLNIASNGSSVIVVESCQSCARTYGHSTTRTYHIIDNSGVHTYNTNVDLLGPAVWTGQSWMFFSGYNKHVLRVVDGFSEDLGEARDYFVTAASNNNGTVLLGGAVSTLGNSQPANPLTAKFVKVTETGATSNNTTSNTTSQNGTSFWTWLDPNQSTIRRDQTITFNVGAWSADGIKRVEMYVNGAVRRMCDLGTAYGNQSCNTVLYGNDYALNTNVAINAKITNGKDQVVWTTLQNLTVTDANGTTNNTNNSDVSVWTTIDPTGSTLNRNASLVFHANATASKGLSRISLFAGGQYGHGSLLRTCNFSQSYGTQTCDTTVYGSNYSAGSQLTLTAEATANDGTTSRSDARIVTVQDNGTTNTNTNQNQQTTDVNGSTWVWSVPENWMIKTGERTIFHVGAFDPNGISTIEMYVNGSIASTCNLGNATGNQECTATINGSSYTVGTSVFVNAKVTDSQGNVMWTPSRTYWIATTSTPNPSSSNTTQAWIWNHPNKTTLNAGEATDFNVGAWDADGLRRIEIWVNGQVKQFCDLGTAYGNQTCAFQIAADHYTAGSDIFVNASVIDAKGNIVWTGSQTYHIQTSNLSTKTNNAGDLSTNLPGWIQISSDRDGGYTTWDKIAFTASAKDTDGIGRIDILVNAVLVKTCLNTSTCTYVGGPYANRSTVSYGAKITDKKGFALWTGYKTINKK